MTTQEIEIKDISSLPDFLYHLVPLKLFSQYLNQKGDYDCRNRKEWGRNAPFIHTSPTRKQLKEKIADVNWINYPLEEKFLLLEIDPRAVKARITYSMINGHIYHHIWKELPKGSFTTLEVIRSQDGKFLV